jgi:hypothetical protein
MDVCSAFLHGLVALGLSLAQVGADRSGERLQAVSESAWSDAADATDFADTAGYREIVAALLALSPADLANLRSVDLDPERALAEPAALRGTFVRVRGRVIGKHDVPLASPIGAQAKIERAIVMLDKQHWIACDMIGSPSPYDLQKDTLELRGVFYRTVKFEAGPERKVQLMPYMLARSMEVVETPASGLMKSLLGGGRELYLGAILGIVGVIVFVMYLRHSARGES